MGGLPPRPKKASFSGLRCTRGRELKDLKGYENLFCSYLKGPIIKISWTETPYPVCKNHIISFTLTFHNVIVNFILSVKKRDALVSCP